METIEGFQLSLKGIIAFGEMYHKKGNVTALIDNASGLSLEELKEAFVINFEGLRVMYNT